MEGNSIVGFVLAFIVAAIVLSVGVTILGSTSSGFDCKNLQGYDSTKTANNEKYPPNTWAGQCWAVQQQQQSSYAILVIVLVVIAAASILAVIRLF